MAPGATEIESSADLGLIGLAVMGQNLALNMNDHGYTVAVFNRTVSKVDEFLAGPADGTQIVPAHSLEELVSRLRRPRKVMLMVKAGAPVDETIAQLLPLLEPGDIVIDGGNSNFEDSTRRQAELEAQGLLFIGTGISGGEEGARHGPSIMPGGSPEAWPAVKELFQAIAAKVDGDVPCCDWVGEGGAGHYVKMVHNGIEYGDMQVIAEAYHLLHGALGLSHAELHDVFAEWNEGKLDSYLIEITRDIFGFLDSDGTPLVEKILDSAGQKGTGKWTVVSSLDLGMAVTLVAEAVYARILSALKEERVQAASVSARRPAGSRATETVSSNDARDALYASKIVSYAQGFMLFRAADAEYGWKLNVGGIALMWRGGCIIRSAFLGKIKEAFERNPDLHKPAAGRLLQRRAPRSRAGLATHGRAAVELAVPAPAYSTALAFFDGYRSEQLPANLIQAQRDYFGAHTYERIDAALAGRSSIRTGSAREAHPEPSANRLRRGLAATSFGYTAPFERQ